MPRLAVSLLAVCLAATSAAQAQSTGGSRGHRGQGGGGQSSSAPAPAAAAAPARAPTPVSEAEMVGIVKAIGPRADQITITYEAAPARNWPAGTTPFTVYRNALLKDVTVGEKIRFKLDSQRITELKPYLATR